MYKAKKQFIAGAICPRCSAMDKLVVFSEQGKDYRECVSCGYKEEMRFQNTPRELETRVNTTEQEKVEQTSVVRLLDPK